MSEANPYESFLDGRPVGAILAETTNTVAEYLEVIGHDRQRTPPAPGKWSAAEVVCHLADCEIAFGFRLRQTLSEDNPTLQPFDQDKWAWAASYADIPASLALEAFSALRKWNLHLIRTKLSTAAARPATHPERGAMTFQTIVETMVGHDLNHLGQLRKIAGKS
jgi:hypothetical protein